VIAKEMGQYEVSFRAKGKHMSVVLFETMGCESWIVLVKKKEFWRISFLTFFFYTACLVYRI
jgi:hypothetical protein